MANETLNIQNGVSPITIDTEPTESSLRPVTSGGIFNAINNALKGGSFGSVYEDYWDSLITAAKVNSGEASIATILTDEGAINGMLTALDYINSTEAAVYSVGTEQTLSPCMEVRGMIVRGCSISQPSGEFFDGYSFNFSMLGDVDISGGTLTSVERYDIAVDQYLMRDADNEPVGVLAFARCKVDANPTII